MTLIEARTLRIVSPRMSGPDVLDVQQGLAELGYAPGPLDGIYGVATVTAVRAFQAAEELDVDGIVGRATRTALEGADRAKPDPSGPSSIGLAALEEARQHIGVKERPPNSNQTPFGQWFGIDGVKWCNVFVSYCFGVGADYTICKGFNGAGVYSKGCTYVPTTEAWLRATGMWIGRGAPQAGDIAIFNWDGGEPDHIGIVERNLGCGSFVCIEGNTSSSNNSDGGAVERRTRRISQINGFGRID